MHRRRPVRCDHRSRESLCPVLDKRLVLRGATARVLGAVRRSLSRASPQMALSALARSPGRCLMHRRASAVTTGAESRCVQYSTNDWCFYEVNSGFSH